MDKGHLLERALSRMVIPLKVPKKNVIISLGVPRKNNNYFERAKEGWLFSLNTRKGFDAVWNCALNYLKKIKISLLKLIFLYFIIVLICWCKK